MNALRTSALSLLCLLGCAHCARPDDALEPNDDAAHATPLTAGQAVEGRANQGNPDVFSLQVAQPAAVLYRLESLGLEDCPAFTATGPDGAVLFRDGHVNCRRQAEPAERVAGASLALVQGFGYELRVPAAAAGTYLLVIQEQGRADNLAPFSWDYRLTALLE